MALSVITDLEVVDHWVYFCPSFFRWRSQISDLWTISTAVAIVVAAVKIGYVTLSFDFLPGESFPMNNNIRTSSKVNETESSLPIPTRNVLILFLWFSINREMKLEYSKSTRQAKTKHT